MISKQLTKKWVEALRSGDYEQGEGHLRVGNHFCCLGVLCELKRVPSELASYANGGVYRYLSPVQSVANVSDVDWFTNPSTPGGLAAMNDEGWSFKQIADAIEFVGLKRIGEVTAEASKTGKVKTLLTTIKREVREAKRASAR